MYTKLCWVKVFLDMKGAFSNPARTQRRPLSPEGVRRDILSPLRWCLMLSELLERVGVNAQPYSDDLVIFVGEKYYGDEWGCAIWCSSMLTEIKTQTKTCEFAALHGLLKDKIVFCTTPRDVVTETISRRRFGVRKSNTSDTGKASEQR